MPANTFCATAIFPALFIYSFASHVTLRQGRLTQPVYDFLYRGSAMRSAKTDHHCIWPGAGLLSSEKQNFLPLLIKGVK